MTCTIIVRTKQPQLLMKLGARLTSQQTRPAIQAQATLLDDNGDMMKMGI
jgi:hypothetical protein